MCGIVGLFSPNNSLYLPEIIRKMCHTLTHRGPDDYGTYIYEDFAIGMRRLSIIDIQTGHQPIFSDDGRYGIVYNGELYNYLEIKNLLLAKGISFKTNSDTEVILKAFIYFDEQCLQLFNGMFAFAIFDKIKKELFIARDRLGVKPLYYTLLPNKGFAFASEIKALLKIPEFNKKINHTALKQYLIFEYIPEPLSIFQTVQKLQSGSFMRFSADRMKVTSYWELEPHTTEEKNIEHTKIKLRSLINSSVKYRLISDVPVGLFLSGGIDSSVIASEMRQCTSNDDVLSFSIGFNDKSYDESHHANIVAKYLNIKHHSRTLNAQRTLELLPQIIKQLDEPLADASIIPTYLLSNFTRTSVKVALSGDGGDELFLGYNTHYAHKLSNYFKFSPPIILKRLLNLIPVSDKNISLEFKIKKFFSAISFPSDIANILWWGAYHPDILPHLMIDKDINFEAIFEPVLRFRKKLTGLDLLKQISFLDIHLYLRDNLLPKVDRASMANSLEVRNPFLDYRLVEYAMKIPSTWKLKGKQGKYILRSAYHGQIPSYILKRPKKGFDIPLTPWLRKELKNVTDYYLSKKLVHETGFFNYSYVQKLIDDHLQKKRNNRQLIWSLLIFQMWYVNYA